MEIRNCKGCNKLFQHIGGPVLCQNCKDALEEKFMEVNLKAFDLGYNL